MGTTQDPLSVEKEFLRTHQADQSAQYPGKHLVIQERVTGAFETYKEGVRAGAVALGVGPFLVTSVHRPDDDETLIVPALTLELL